jgi:NAD(P)-dependent dehydrogenase (short-subunit alcohol dehydrogenase family)
MKYLLVGGNSVIGTSLIKSLLQKGHTCYVISRSELEIKDENILFRQLNIAKEDFPADFLPEELDGMVYLPGTINLKPFRTLKPEAFQEAIDINFLGAVKSIQAAEASLKKSEGAGIVLFSTVAVQTGMPFHAAVASAKGAVEGLTRSLAAEFAPGIRVNCIAPSLTKTKMAERFLSNESKIEASQNRHPLKEVGDPEDLAKMAEYLLSKDAKWISGQIIGIDGGIGSLRTN